jgi:hypothetical protein
VPHLDVYERCARWVQRNTNVPGRADVLDLFEWFAREFRDELFEREPRADGRPWKMSVYEITERIRWAFQIRLHVDDLGFKVSNDYKPILARILCYRIPGLEEFIFLRPLIGGEPTAAQIFLIDENGSYIPTLLAQQQAAAANGEHIPRTPVPREEPV